MTNLQLLAEVRRFFPRARPSIDRQPALREIRLDGGLSLYIDDQEWRQGMSACIATHWGPMLRFTRGMSVAEVLRALGFADRKRGHHSRYRQEFSRFCRRFQWAACPLQSAQRPRKGALLGARKRREAANAIHP